LTLKKKEKRKSNEVIGLAYLLYPTGPTMVGSSLSHSQLMGWPMTTFYYKPLLNWAVKLPFKFFFLIFFFNSNKEKCVAGIKQPQKSKHLNNKGLRATFKLLEWWL
jgi:hypothetical protein